MALTKTFGDALDIAYSTIKRSYEDAFATESVNLATSFIWNKGDWRESLAEFTPFWLIPNEQDHGKPTFTVPDDFLGLREVFVVNLQGSTPIKSPVNVRQNLDRTAVMGVPQLISYVPANRVYRLWPRVPSGLCVPNWLIEGTYKKVSPAVAAADLNNEFIPWDDQYFMNYVETLTWVMMKLAGDPRMGGVQGKTFTRQYGNAVSAVQVMLEQEGFNLGDDQIAPGESLLGGGGHGNYFYW